MGPEAETYSTRTNCPDGKLHRALAATARRKNEYEAYSPPPLPLMLKVPQALPPEQCPTDNQVTDLRSFAGEFRSQP